MTTIYGLSKVGNIKGQYKKFIGRRVAFILALIPVIVLFVGISSSLGSADVSLRDVYAAILNRFFPGSFETNWLVEVCVWKLMLPRILMGILAGIGLGAVLLVLSDTVARTIMSPVILTVGVVTAFLGVPLFIYLIMRKRRTYW